MRVGTSWQYPQRYSKLDTTWTQHCNKAAAKLKPKEKK